jgi:hypothetical protein
MHHFKIAVTPIASKRLELIQTMESLLQLYRPFCEDINLKESQRMIFITGTVKDMQQLKKITDSKEFEVFNGALSILAIKTEFNIVGNRE